MRLAKITDSKTWEEIADQHHAPLPQRWLYGEAVRCVGREVSRTCLFDRDQPVMAMQAATRRICGVAVSLASRGPIGPESPPTGADSPALRRMKQALPRGVRLISPDQPPPKHLALSAAPEIAEIDLRPELSSLRAALHGKWRNALVKAEASRLRVARLQASVAVLMPLLQAEKTRQKTVKYRALPAEFTLAIQSIAPRSLRIFSASDAQMLFIVHGNSATYHMGHSGSEGRGQNAHNLILWTAIERLKEEGVERLDLGTIDRKRAPNLARFKCRTGAQSRKIGAAYLI